MEYWMDLTQFVAKQNEQILLGSLFSMQNQNLLQELLKRAIYPQRGHVSILSDIAEIVPLCTDRIP
jgi:hypothetical protein